MDITNNIKSVELTGTKGKPEIVITYKDYCSHKRKTILDKLSGKTIPISVVGEIEVQF